MDNETSEQPGDYLRDRLLNIATICEAKALLIEASGLRDTARIISEQFRKLIGKHSVEREVDCPRCHQLCGWCSDYRHMHGTLNLPGTRRRCTMPNMAPEGDCPLCAGSKRVVSKTQYFAARERTDA